VDNKEVKPSGIEMNTIKDGPSTCNAAKTVGCMCTGACYRRQHSITTHEKWLEAKRLTNGR